MVYAQELFIHAFVYEPSCVDRGGCVTISPAGDNNILEIALLKKAEHNCQRRFGSAIHWSTWGF